MHLVRLVYASSKGPEFTPESLENVLASAKQHNARDHITGLLCFNSQYFLQCLEGTRTAVNKTYQRIVRDGRHEDIVLLSYEEIYSREFSHWSMGFVPASSLTQAGLIKYSGSPFFNPYELTGESAHRMLSQLREAVPVV